MFARVNERVRFPLPGPSCQAGERGEKSSPPTRAICMRRPTSSGKRRSGYKQRDVPPIPRWNHGQQKLAHAHTHEIRSARARAFRPSGTGQAQIVETGARLKGQPTRRDGTDTQLRPSYPPEAYIASTAFDMTATTLETCRDVTVVPTHPHCHPFWPADRSTAFRTHDEPTNLPTLMNVPMGLHASALSLMS